MTALRLRRTALLIGLAGTTTAALTCCPTAAPAHSTGEIGHSGKQGSSCNACHSGGMAPTVRFTGPDTVAPGETATFRFEVESMRAAQRAAGFNVAASAGALSVIDGQGEQLVGAAGELTHTSPKANVDMLATWDFQWTAPAAAGAATLFGAGNSVNRNGQNSGDRAATTTFAITVVEAAATATATEPPTPTFTATPVPTEPPAPTLTPVPTEPPTPTFTATPVSSPGVTPTDSLASCAGDCDGSRVVAVNELVTGVGVALGTLAIDACRAADLDHDGRIGINELVAAVTSALDGCR